MKNISIIFIFLSLVFSGCAFQSKSQPKTFYTNFGGFDILYIPIIKPYRAESTTNGDSWMISAADETQSTIRLRKNTSGGIPVKSFGVSKNFIFGQTHQDDFKYAETDVWFIFKANTGVYADYETKEEMLEVLKLYKVTKPQIFTCTEYNEILKTKKTLYWYPAADKEYPTFDEDTSKNPVPVSIILDSKGGMSFTVPKTFKKDPSKIYWFKVDLNSDKNELYYISVDETSPVLVKNGLMFPVFIYESTVNVTVYTPFPVAEEKGISEEDRVVVSKMMVVE